MHRVSIQSIIFKREKKELKVPEAFRHLSSQEFPPLPVDKSEHLYFLSPQVVLVAPDDGQKPREIAIAGWCKSIALPRISELKKLNVPSRVLDTYACPEANLKYIQPAPDFLADHLANHRSGSFWIVDNKQEAWLVHVTPTTAGKPEKPL